MACKSLMGKPKLESNKKSFDLASMLKQKPPKVKGK